jgi:hypothetical protein
MVILRSKPPQSAELHNADVAERRSTIRSQPKAAPVLHPVPAIVK